MKVTARKRIQAQAVSQAQRRELSPTVKALIVGVVGNVLANILSRILLH